jgi:aminoglycoside 3-N-acetyltransferase
MRLAVHARLLSFGQIEGGVQTAYTSLREAVGPSGTLVFPTYTVDLEAQSVFDPLRTASRRNGALSNYAMEQDGAIRTRCPIHSHVAIGPDASLLMMANARCSLGHGSSFEVMHKSGFNLLLLGCTAHEGATFVHHVEAIVGVPYRHWVTLKRQVALPDGSVEMFECPYYARRMDYSVRTNLARLHAAAIQISEVSVVPIGSRESVLVSLDALDTCTKDLLHNDPYALVEPIHSMKAQSHDG